MICSFTDECCCDGPFSVGLRRMNGRALSEPNAEIYYAHNYLYSPVALIDNGGNGIERYEYNAYGKRYVMDADYQSRSSSNYNNVIAFTGQRLDSLDYGDLPLMYYKNRLYCPTTGRFLQRDPLGYFDGINLYEYCQSNPRIHTDPYGETIFGFPENEEEFKALLGKVLNKIKQSKDPSERCRLLRILYSLIAHGARSKEMGVALDVWGFPGPLAADFMLHWLGGSGKRQFMNKNLVLSDPVAKAWYDFWKKDTINWVNTHKCDDFEGLFSANTIPILPDSILNPELFYAVGQFIIRAAARSNSRSKCPPCSLHIEFKLTFIDRYNWTPGDSVPLFGYTIPDDYALELETCDHPHGAVKPKPFNLNTGFWESLGCVKCLK